MSLKANDKKIWLFYESNSIFTISEVRYVVQSRI